MGESKVKWYNERCCGDFRFGKGVSLRSITVTLELKEIKIEDVCLYEGNCLWFIIVMHCWNNVCFLLKYRY